MDPLFIIILLGVIGAGGYYLYRRRAAPVAATPEPTPTGGIEVTPDLSALKTGDAISFWDNTDATVLGVITCREAINGRETSWKWVFLSGDKVLELLPRGQVLYTGQAVAHQGDEFFELLVGAGGVLKRFEGNVREGIAHEPVELQVDDTVYRVRSTGTFTGALTGAANEVAADVWGSLGTGQPDNVYFKLVPSDEANDTVALGIWTSHILMLTGRSIGRGEIANIFAA
ncbi:MAG: hypothetical protein EPO26_03730 [Chloroflexota bacterium]|nr:MAG: hypothetical protein EPO26_03730 [Chloroflexota bacterium]